MSALKNTLGALGLVFMSSGATQALDLSDLRGVNGVPDNAATDCARQTLLTISETWPGQIMQENITYQGELTHQFILFHDASEQESHVDVVQRGQGYHFTYAAIKGDIDARMQALQANLSSCAL